LLTTVYVSTYTASCSSFALKMATAMRVETLKEAENITTLHLVKPMGQETMNSYAFHLQLPETLQRQIQPWFMPNLEAWEFKKIWWNERHVPDFWFLNRPQERTAHHTPEVLKNIHGTWTSQAPEIVSTNLHDFTTLTAGPGSINTRRPGFDCRLFVWYLGYKF